MPLITVREFCSGIPLVNVGALWRPVAHYSFLKTRQARGSLGMSEEMLVHSPMVSAESAIGPVGISKITGGEGRETGCRHHGTYGRAKQSLTAGSKFVLGITNTFV